MWRHGIDVVHLHTGPGGALLRGRLPAPLVVTANHTYADQATLPGEGWKKIFVPWERRTYRVADAVACLSYDTQRSVIDQYGIDPSKLSVIGCGFDLAPFITADHDRREPYTAVFVGRPETRKGWDILVSAWKILRYDVPEAVLHVIGFHDHQPGMQFHGRVTDDELRRRVGRSSLLVMPSRLEGFGLAAAEAISTGTPVVGCDVLGLRNVVSKEAGILVPTSDIALADAIKKVFSDAVLWQSLHAGCRRERAAFELQKEIDAYLSLYDAVYSCACTQR
jgi:glycosyltransferase involved in cell wall biosynthesis